MAASGPDSPATVRASTAAPMPLAHRVAGFAALPLFVVEQQALTVFLLITMLRNWSVAGTLIGSSGMLAGLALRKLVLAFVSLRNTRNAAWRLAGPGYRVSEVDDLATRVGEDVFAELHRPSGDSPKVRVFATLSRAGVQVDDRTFVSYVGTSYVCMARDPREARTSAVQFRLLHELGHISHAALGSIEDEYVRAIQLGALGVLVYLFAPVEALTISVVALLILCIYTILKPHGPNWHSLSREILADRFAIRHLAPDEAKSGVHDALVRIYRAQSRELEKAAPDGQGLSKISSEFYDHPRVSLIDRLRPSYHLSRNPIWLRDHERQRMGVRIHYAQRSLNRRRGEEPGTDTASVRLPGWWGEARPMLTAPLVILAGFLVDIPGIAAAWFSAAALVIYLASAVTAVRALSWDSFIDRVVAGEERVPSTEATDPEPDEEPLPLSWPRAVLRAIPSILLMLGVGQALSRTPIGLADTLHVALTQAFPLQFAPFLAYSLARTHSNRVATASTWMSAATMAVIGALLAIRALG